MAHELRRASRAMKAAYAVGEFGVALANAAIASFLMWFYTDVALLGIAAAGSVKFLGRVWDAVNDPLMGYLSDRTRSRFGRRRVWFPLGAAPLWLALWALFSPPEGMSQLALFGWMLLSYALVDLCFTVFLTPFYALGAELSEDPEERTQIVALRTFAAYAGAIAGNTMPLLVAVAFAPNSRDGFGTIALVFGVVSTFSMLVVFFGTREPPVVARREASAADFARGVRVSFANRPFRILLATFVVMSIGGGLNGAVAIYAIIYWIGFTSAAAGWILPVYLGAASLALPLWSAAARRFGKDRALKTVCVYEVFVLGSIWFLPPAPQAFFVFLAFAGFGLAGFIVAGSLLADVLDHDELASGEQRGGAFFGFWTFATKLAGGLGAPVVGFVLDGLGYVPNQSQSATVVEAIRWLYGPIPAVFFAAAALLCWRFPLDRATHGAIQRELHQRRAAAAGARAG
jgi:GPH family glycoside/pentoside/hexuronide:cation symporter